MNSPLPFSNYQNVPYSVSGNSSQNNGILVVPIQSNDSVATYPVAAGTTVMLMNYPAKKSYEENEYSGRRRSYENRERMTDIYPRYENRDSYRGSRRSYNDYSGHDNDITDKMVAKLDDMMAEAKTDHERDIINKWISRISEN